MCVALCLCLTDEYRTLPRLYRGKLSLINAIADISHHTEPKQVKTPRTETIRTQRSNITVITRGTI